MMNEKPRETAVPTAKLVALMLAAVALGGFIGGWAYVAVRGEDGGYHLCLRSATGGMLGALFGTVVTVVTAWAISGRVEPLAFIVAVGGGMACGSHAARDGAWMAGTIGILVGSVLGGIAFGVMGRLGLMARRPSKDPPSATPGVY
jgi:hypothetical protein